MLKINCDVCGEELDEPGALLFSPPADSDEQDDYYCSGCDKYHICVTCYRRFIQLINEKTEKLAQLARQKDTEDRVWVAQIYDTENNQQVLFTTSPQKTEKEAFRLANAQLAQSPYNDDPTHKIRTRSRYDEKA